MGEKKNPLNSVIDIIVGMSFCCFVGFFNFCYHLLLEY